MTGCTAVKTAMANKGMTAKTLAEKTNISESRIEEILTGTKPASKAELYTLANELGMANVPEDANHTQAA